MPWFCSFRLWRSTNHLLTYLPIQVLTRPNVEHFSDWDQDVTTKPNYQLSWYIASAESGNFIKGCKRWIWWLKTLTSCTDGWTVVLTICVNNMWTSFQHFVIVIQHCYTVSEWNKRTGYRYASLSTSRWPHSYTSSCLAFHHRTWPTTAVLSPMLVSGDCVPQRAEHA